jgi:SAM-dependent methyltransferase
MSDKIHSDEYLHADSRQDWWNHDYLDLLSRRLKLHQVRTLADIGCGTGCLGRLLLPHLPALETLFGLDREAAHVAEATTWFTAPPAGDSSGGQGRAPWPKCRFVKGDARSIPLPDDAVDLAVCQTLLIHVADPRAVLAEMRRVVKPGGLVLALEPNNAVQSLIRDHRYGDGAPGIEMRLADIEFALRVEAGKAALGEGDNSMGDQVPRFFAELGLKDIRVSLNDQAVPVLPPYTPAAQSYITDAASWLAQGRGPYDREESRRWYLAGGGNPDAFAAVWAARLEDARAWLEACGAGNWYSPGASLFYVVAGRK